MDIDNKVYHSRYFSETGRSLIGLMVILLALFLVFLYMNSLIGMTICMIVFLLLLTAFIKGAPNVEVDDVQLRVGKYQVSWDEIEKVEFTVGMGKDLGNLHIVVYSPLGKLNIHIRDYTSPRELRENFEEICHRKNIRCVVEDRGLY